jgi:hypothetical protein
LSDEPIGDPPVPQNPLQADGLRVVPPLPEDPYDGAVVRKANGHDRSRVPGEDDGPDYVTPGRRTVEEAKKAPADPELTRALEDLRARLGAVTGRRRLHFEAAADFIAQADKPVDWLITGLATRLGVVGIAAEPKAAKTWVGLDLAMAVATGSEALGEFQTHAPGHVALFCAEDDRASLARRLRSLGAGRGLDPALAVERIHIISRETLDLDEPESAADLIAAARSIGHPLSLLVLDPLRDLHSVDENDSTGMARVMGSIRAIRDILQCTVAFIHHAAKATKDNADRREGQKMRGSSAIHGAVDCGVYLSDLDTDGQSYWISKVTSEIKAARGAGVFRLRLDVEDDGERGAVKATWSTAREGKTSDGTTVAKPSKPVDIDLQGKVLACLRSSARTGVQSISGGDVAAICGKNRNAVIAALYALEAGGFAKHVMRGIQPHGWTVGPNGETPDAEDVP